MSWLSTEEAFKTCSKFGNLLNKFALKTSLCFGILFKSFFFLNKNSFTFEIFLFFSYTSLGKIYIPNTTTDFIFFS